MLVLAFRRLLTSRVKSLRRATAKLERECSEADERAGEEERRRLEAALDLAATMVRTTDGIIQVWSAGCSRLFGYTRDEAVGRRVRELLRTECPVSSEEIEAALARDGEWGGELTQHRRDGSAVWVSTHWVLQRDAAGCPVAIMENSTDATDLRRVREALAASEAEFRASFELVAVGKAEIDAVSLKIRRVNAALAEMLGYSDPAALIGLTLREFIAPEHQAITRAQYEHLMAGKTESFTMERRHIRRDGTALWVRACVAGLRRPGEPTPSRLLVTVEDIDARYQAEQALRTSEAQARFLVDATGMGIYELDVPRRMLRGNARAAFICGDILPADTWVPLEGPEYARLLERIHPDDHAVREEATRSLLSGAVDTNVIELRIQRPDGSWGWSFHQRAVVARDRTGQPLWILGMVSDVSVRAQAEAALRKNEAWLRDFKDELEQALSERTAELATSEARFRAIFDSQFQFTGFLAPDGTLLEANKTTIEVSGVKREEVVGRPFWEAAWWLEADRELIRQAIAQAASGEFIRREMEVVAAGGRSLWIDFSLTPLRNPETGAVEFIIPEGRDRTEHRALQAQLARAQKLEAVGQLTAGVAHDFNNLLTVVSGNAERLRAAVERSGDQRNVRYTQAIERAAERGGRLASQLLAFSRKQVLHPDLVVVRDLLAGMEDLLRRAVNETIAVEIRSAPDLWPCLVDPAQLESAVLNLMLNARDALPESGGRIVIEAGNVSFASHQMCCDLPAGEYVRLDVADNGSGMTPEVLAHVFEPFFTTKEIGRGSGLGLAQVHGFVGQSGGAVDIASELGRGTTVSLYLPRAAATIPQQPVVAARPVVHGAGRSVLVVEDEADLRESVGDILEDAGYRVLTASDAEAARQILASERRVDLLFTDMVLPGGTSGVQLAHEVREREPRARVLLTSGYAREDLEPRALLSGEFDILRKPYAVPALLRKVREMFAAA